MQPILQPSSSTSTPYVAGYTGATSEHTAPTILLKRDASLSEADTEIILRGGASSEPDDLDKILDSLAGGTASSVLDSHPDIIVARDKARQSHPPKKGESVIVIKRGVQGSIVSGRCPSPKEGTPASPTIEAYIATEKSNELTPLAALRLAALRSGVTELPPGKI